MINIEQYVVNQFPVWKGNISRINGEQHANMPKFVVRMLSRTDVEDMSKLSSLIYSHLNKGEECFIHKNSAEYYHQVFDNEDIMYIGAFVGSKLVGMSYICVCDNEKKLESEIPNNPVKLFDTETNKLAVSLGGDCVHPSYRGNGLNQVMIQYRLNLAKAIGCTDAFSIIDRNNQWNMPPYFKNGFNMFACTIDPADGGKIALMHHNITSKNNILKASIKVPYSNFAQIDMLLSRGFIGCSYDKKDKTIEFAKNNSGIKLYNRKHVNPHVINQSNRGYDV